MSLTASGLCDPGRPMRPEEVLAALGSCPRCRRTVLQHGTGWRRAVPGRPAQDGRPAVLPEAGNVLGLLPALRPSPTDPLPRDRTVVLSVLPGAVFSRRYGAGHSCSAPEVVPDPVCGYGPRNGSKLAQVYDGGGDA